MARRMSSRERMEHMRAEADAAAKEKEENRKRSAANPAPKSKRAAAAQPAGKVRFVWSVRNQRGDEVKFYPYPQEAEAHAEAERLTEENDRAHFVTKAEKPAQ